MKRRIVTIVIAVMMASIMASCGNEDAPTNAIPTSSTEPTVEPEPTTEPTIDNSEDGVVGSGTLEDIPTSEPNEDGNASLGEVSNVSTRYNFTESWNANGNNAEGWNDAYSYVDGSGRVYNVTHFVTGNGDEMNFSWTAHVNGIGTYAGLSSNEITFVMNDAETPTYCFYVWNYGPMSTNEELMKNSTSDLIISWAVGTHVTENYQVEDTDEFYRVTFKESMELNGKNYIGYACFVDYYDIMECWQYEYFVLENLYNEDDALAVINSITRIDLEEYESTLTTNE